MTQETLAPQLYTLSNFYPKMGITALRWYTGILIHSKLNCSHKACDTRNCSMGGVYMAPQPTLYKITLLIVGSILIFSWYQRKSLTLTPRACRDSVRTCIQTRKWH